MNTILHTWKNFYFYFADREFVLHTAFAITIFKFFASKKNLGILCLLVFFSAGNYNVKAQDPHFSQFFASPILLNPALTGAFPGNLRTSGSYREQWPSIMYPFRTGTFSIDGNILHNKIGEGDIFGVGLTGIFDNSNNNGLKSNTLSPSLSFHKTLYNDGVANYSLGGGFMASMNTKVLDYSRFIFGQQLTPQGYDPNLATGENKNGFTTVSFDYSAGLVYSAITEDNSYYIGASMYHINKPKESFNGPTHIIVPRYVLHGGGSFLAGVSNRLYYSCVYMKAESYSELVMGLVYGVGLTNTYSYDEDKNDITVLAGVWYRYNDAVIPYIGAELGNIRAGLSYDVNVSKLNPASNLKGGFELSISYTVATSEAARIRQKTLCPGGKQSHLKWFGY